MQNTASQKLFSATDIVNFSECVHLTSLDLIDLDTPLTRAVDDDQLRLVQEKGNEYEATYLKSMQAKHGPVIDISRSGRTNQERQVATIDAMRQGAPVIYQATLLDDQFVGHADFLLRVEFPSKLGNYSYEVVDTKLAHRTKAKYLVQLMFYSDLLAKVQGVSPRSVHVALGNGKEEKYRVASYQFYFANLRARFLDHVNGPAAKATYPEPCARCDTCHWREICKQKWLDDDHLSQVANINKSQIERLNEAGIKTLRALGEMPSGTLVPSVAKGTLERLRHQASLQLRARQTGRRFVEPILPLPDEKAESGPRGFARLPAPADGDLFFDMEGDPFYGQGGLEYLFGLYFLENGQPRFKPFWAHSHSEERFAFEQFTDFVTAHLNRYPQAHIYHYAAYEETALKKLMCRYGTREKEIDQILRRQKLVDLYRVVRESIRTSEPKYSIKNIEHFYRGERHGEVKDAGASIIFYGKWKENGDPTLLQAIEDYNKDDVISTAQLRDWLISQRPKDLAWIDHNPIHEDVEEEARKKTKWVEQHEQRLQQYEKILRAGISDEDGDRLNPDDHRRRLLFWLLDFYRRAAKPQWWMFYKRKTNSLENNREDPECIVGLTPDPNTPTRQEARSTRYTYCYTEQETKLRSGDQCVEIESGSPLNDLKINPDAFTVSFRMRSGRVPFETPFNIGLGKPINSDKLQAALMRYADSVIVGRNEGWRSEYPAIDAIMRRDAPRLKGRKAGTSIVSSDAKLTEIIAATAELDSSYLFIQGPPGAGKTYTGSALIVALLKMGKRIGVSSMSHKAINNLLKGVEAAAAKDGFKFKGCKKSNRGNLDQHVGGQLIIDVWENEKLISDEFQLVAGTAWLFAEPDLDRKLDYLFVDEAGQVALANLIAMATSARNVVLLGDQMQLNQPVQGVHPGESGASCLEYLLADLATIPPDRGIFLGTTWRLHPRICSFISEAVYDGRLKPQPETKRQVLRLGSTSDDALSEAGIRFIPVAHEGCANSSKEEAARVREIYDDLLRQEFVDKNGESRRVTSDNILVVAPYNLQVAMLRRVLPENAKIGTVDKFQGQEAEVVIVSMATSSSTDMPRNLEFLFSKHRLNVAISRAKSLAVVVASPRLLQTPCSTPEQMELVNILCWVAQQDCAIAD